MTTPTITALRAFVPDTTGGADYHAQRAGHWIDDHIASPMAKYPEYRESRRSFGLSLLGNVVVEVEASDGTVGFAPTTGGEPAAWIIENRRPRALGPARQGARPAVHAMIGGAVRDEIPFYATGPRPDVAQKLGFIGGKLPLQHGPAEGDEGIAATVARLAAARDAVGPGFWLMLDCWMSPTLDHAVRLAHALDGVGLRWLEEPLLPDDYWSHATLRERMPAGMLLSSGEHESTRYGFRALLELGRVDLVQPDVGWCGGLTELLRISALAEAHGAMVVPRGSSVYSYHFVATRQHSPFAEFLMMHPDGTEVVPMFSPLLVDEPVRTRASPRRWCCTAARWRRCGRCRRRR